MFRAQRFIGAAANFSQWVQDQFQRVERESLAPAELLSLSETTRAPDKPRAGDVRRFGASYDPGSGAGLYWFDGSTWNKL